MSEILCLGEAMVEFVRQNDGRYLQGFGGDTSNAAIAAARQGADVGYVSAVGDDRFGLALRALWSSEGVDDRTVATNTDAPTGIYFVDPDPDGRFFTYYRAGSAASRLQPAQLSAEAIRAAKVLHLSGITLAVSSHLRETAFKAIELATGTVCLDTNLRLKLWSADQARAIIHQAAARSGIIVTSIDDSATLTGLSDPRSIADFYHDLGAAIVLVTQGAAGCYLSMDRMGTDIAPVHAVPVDSTGAGDSFTGAFLAWWLETEDAVLSAQRAAEVAAKVVSGYGTVDPIPRRPV